MSEHWSFRDPMNPLPPGEPVPGKTYRADGWMYKDFPRFEPDVWDSLLLAIGTEHFVPLSLANYGTSKRGQLLISPQGVINCIGFLKAKAENLREKEAADGQ